MDYSKWSIDPEEAIDRYREVDPEKRQGMVIGITGLPRSGKNTAAHYLSSRYGFQRFDFFTDVIVPELHRHSLAITKANAIDMGVALRKELGMGAAAHLLLGKINGYRRIVVTGFRSVEEVNLFRRFYNFFSLVEIQANINTRLERRQGEEFRNIDAFYERERRDKSELGLTLVISSAEYRVPNETTLDILHCNLEKLMIGRQLPHG